METSDLKAVVDSDMKKRRRYQAGFFVGLGIAALVSFMFLVMKFPAHPPLSEKEETPAPISNAYTGVSLTAKAAIVYDLATGTMLYGKNEESQLPLASLTKLLTIYAAAETMSPETPIAISARALAEEGDSGFVEGDTFTFYDLARLALVGSSNDAASAIAEEAGRERSFTSTALLASAVQAAGLTQTYAVNGTGLDESVSTSGGYGSARDVALLAGALIKKAPDIASATTNSGITVSSSAGKPVHLENTNPAAQTVPGALLSKTGYTDLAGGNLAVVFDAGINHPVAIVVLGSTKEGRFTDVNRLLDRTLDTFASL